MPRASLRSLGFSLRLGGLSLGLTALIALPASCGLDAEGEQFTGSNPSGVGGTGGAGVGGGGGSGGGNVCMPGSMQACYSGPAGTETMGACTPGVTTCDEDGSGWGPCVGEVVPGTETCATEIDDDCDGMVNEGGDGCACTPNVDMKPCYSGPMGTDMNPPCKAGTQTCNANGDGFGPCMGEVQPGMESCSTPEDENCNAAEMPMADPPVADVAAGCVCIPGTKRDCYSGPSGTKDVGICTGGTETCNADGYGYGPCSGEVVPADENCVTKNLDENCDGSSMELCPGETNWSKRGGDGANQEALAVAVNAAGDIVVVGAYQGTLNLGASVTSNGQTDAFVALYDKDGALQWLKGFGSNQDERATAVAFDPMGNIIVGGTFNSTSVDFTTGGGPALMNLGSLDGFVVKLDELGSHIWSKALGGGDIQQVTSVDAGGNGDVHVCGSFKGTPNFGTGALTNGGGYDYFLAKLKPGDGVPLWVKPFGDGSDQLSCRVAADGMSSVLAAPLNGGADFGGGLLTSAGSLDVVVAKFDATGAHLWSKRFGDGGYQDVTGVDVDGMGRAVVTGTAQGTVNFGGGALTASGFDAMVLRLNADGSHSFSKFVGGVTDQRGRGVAVGEMNSMVLVGYYGSSVDYGGGVIQGNSEPDIFVVKLDAAGTYNWGETFASGGSQLPEGVAADAAGNVALVGTFSGGGIDFGGAGNNHANMGGNDLFVAKLQK